MLKLTTDKDKQEALHGLSATAELLVAIYTAFASFEITKYREFFWSHRVQTLVVLYAALGFSCSTRCPLPRKHQLQLPPPTVKALGGVIGQTTV